MTSPESKQSIEYQKIVKSICEELTEVTTDAGPFTAETDLTKDVEIDSASIMILVFAIEEQFDVSVPLNELSLTRTVGDLAGLIQRLKPQP